MRDNCYYLQSDYVWDDEIGDEYEVFSCEKGIDLKHCNENCKIYKEYKPEPHVEKDTKCDLCEYKEKCDLIEITQLEDTRRHFIGGHRCILRI